MFETPLYIRHRLANDVRGLLAAVEEAERFVDVAIQI